MSKRMMEIINVWKNPNYCQSNPAPPVSDSWKQQKISWAIFYHIGHNWDSLPGFIQYWTKFPVHHLPTIVFSYHDDQCVQVLEDNKKIVGKSEHMVNDIIWIKVPNRGGDVYPFFYTFDVLGQKSDEFILILKIHSKKSNQEWIEILTGDNLPSPDWIDWFLNIAYLNDYIGMICNMTEKLDWINAPLLVDYWIRGGVIPRPIYSADKLPPYDEIKTSYERDIDSQFVLKYPPPKNQYRKSGLIYDPHVYWWQRENPMGMKTEGHRISVLMQEYPFFVQYFQQIGISPGTVFWISPKVCRLILAYFPITNIYTDIENGIIKDNVWQRNAHTWERFFASYVFIQGFTIIDTKHAIHFKAMPHSLVERSFGSWEEMDTPFPDRKSTMSQPVLPISSTNRPQTPWFPKMNGKIIPQGVSTGCNAIYPILITGPKKITNNNHNNNNNDYNNKNDDGGLNKCDELIQKVNWMRWIELTRVPNASDNPIWQHVVLNDKQSIVNYLDSVLLNVTLKSETAMSQKTPWVTIWTLRELNYFIFEQIELRNLFWLTPRMWVENKPDYSSVSSLYIWIIEMINQVAFTWPSNTKVQFVNFEIVSEKTIGECLLEFEKRKQDHAFYGPGLLNTWLCLQARNFHNSVMRSMSTCADGPIQFIFRAPFVTDEKAWIPYFEIFNGIELLFSPTRELRKTHMAPYMLHTYNSELEQFNRVIPWLQKSDKCEIVICNEDPVNYIFLYNNNRPLYAKGNVNPLPPKLLVLEKFLNNENIKLCVENAVFSEGSHIIIELHVSPINVSENIAKMGCVHQQYYQSLICNSVHKYDAHVAIGVAYINGFIIYTKILFRANTTSERMLFKPIANHCLNMVNDYFPVCEIYYSA